jgi:threonine synthase
MDILISSNLERLLYFTAGSELTARYMNELKTDGRYTVSPEVKAEIDRSFKGYFADEAETARVIRDTYGNHGYLADTHTAVAISAAEQYVRETGDVRPMVIDSTASPYKFANNVYTAVTGKAPTDDLSALDLLAKVSGEKIPLPLDKIGERAVRFTNTCDPKDMKDTVLAFANA